jgi:hypothetical protein
MIVPSDSIYKINAYVTVPYSPYVAVPCMGGGFVAVCSEEEEEEFSPHSKTFA